MSAQQSAVPSYLRAQCKALRGAQFAFISRAVVWCAQLTAASDDGVMPKAASMARTVCADYPELAEKTIANYLGTAQALAVAHKGIIRALLAGTGADDWPATAAQYVAHLVKALADGGYTQSEPDMRALSTGGLSAKAKAAALVEQQRKDTEAAALAAAAAKLGEQNPAPVEEGNPAPVEEGKTEPVPSEERAALGADEAPAPAPVLPPVAPIVGAPVVMFTAARKHDGLLAFTVNPEMTAGEMLTAMLALEQARGELLAKLTETAPTIPADVRTEPAPKTRKAKAQEPARM